MIDQFKLIYYYYEFYYYCGCVLVCKGVCGYAQGWAGVHRCAQVCTGVCKSVWMSASVCVGRILRISTGE